MSRLDKFNALLLALIFAAMPCWAQFTVPFATGAAKSSGGGSTPTVVQTAGDATHCGVFATNPSTACAMPSNLASGDYLVIRGFAGAGGSITTWNTPTFSGAGCPTTATVEGATGASFAQWVTNATSAGACTITVSGANTANAGLQAVIKEYKNINGTVDTASEGALAFCTSCTYPASALTTTVSGDLASICASLDNSTTFTWTSPFTVDGSTFTNSTSAQTVGCATYIQPTAGASSLQASWTLGAGQTPSVSLIALEP